MKPADQYPHCFHPQDKSLLIMKLHHPNENSINYTKITMCALTVACVVIRLNTILIVLGFQYNIWTKEFLIFRKLTHVLISRTLVKSA